MCKPLPCGCGKKFKSNINYQKHIDTFDYASRMFQTAEQLKTEIPGNSTSTFNCYCATSYFV